MAGFNKGFILRRRGFVVLTLLAFGLALSIGAFLWQSVQTSSIAVVQARIDALKPFLTAIRLFLIAWVAMVWPFLTRSLHRRGYIDKAQAATLLALRWRLITWLVVIELVLGQNLPGQVLAALQGGRA